MNGRRCRTAGPRWLAGAAAGLVALSGCGSSGHHSTTPPATTTPATTLPASTTTTATTVPTAQRSGPRTVLSPLGLHVRAQPSTTAGILGTAAQGAVLAVLANNGHGWLQVKGATHTGWITDDPSYSAPGTFATYTSASNQFGALYPTGWTDTEYPPANVVFRAPAPGTDTIVVTSAAKVAELGPGRPGYHSLHSQQIVVCGITSDLDTYSATPVPVAAATPGTTNQKYLAQIRLTLDPTHALGITANLSDLSALSTVRNFASSVTFPFPQCQG